MKKTYTKTFKILIVIAALFLIAGFVYSLRKNLINNSKNISGVGIAGNVSGTQTDTTNDSSNSVATNSVASTTGNENGTSGFDANTENVLEKKSIIVPVGLDMSATSTDEVAATTTPVQQNTIATDARCFVSAVDYHSNQSALITLSKQFPSIQNSGCFISSKGTGHSAIVSYCPVNQIMYYAYPKNLGAVDYRDVGISTGIQVSTDGGASYNYNNAWAQDTFTITNSEGEQEIYYLYGYLFDGLLEPQNSNFIIKFP